MFGIRGGDWNNDATNLRVSDRNNAGNTNADRNNNIGARVAKTSELYAWKYHLSSQASQNDECGVLERE